MNNKQPLDGVRIVDLTHEWAGPHAARLMADFGAEVIKVEYFRRMDVMRGHVASEEGFNSSIRLRQLARNKRSMILDLHDTRDASVFADLVSHSDAVISNSRPGVLTRLGFDYPRLKAIREDIILISLSSNGATGPEASYAGYGGGIEATSGLQSLTGYDADSEPRRVREMDVTNGIVAAASLMTALVRRQREGTGSWIDLSEIEACSHALAGEHLLAFASNAGVVTPRGNRHPNHAPHGCYKCRGEDEWVVISIDSDSAWKNWCEAACMPELAADELLANVEGRRALHDELDSLIGQWTADLDKLEVMNKLQAVGVIAGPVMSVQDLHGDRHLAARDFFIPSNRGTGDPVFPGVPFRLSPGISECRPGPALGEANQDVTVNLLGRPEPDVRHVRDEAVGTDFDVDFHE
ncbi:CoA transferase [Haliea sp. E1-2-M8]|uniref:CaiB/BaiF CoA transferase family protein n=1 Tax=Haliea sp. E1-2-M8 TaxID=3064706 RepID=UPI00271DE13C|nr:CoA transferase [Haliea sp. E1-2-M8]MDO8861544.1 CoA transferase [Haliea sp. E1-2-M8]